MRSNLTPEQIAENEKRYAANLLIMKHVFGKSEGQCEEDASQHIDFWSEISFHLSDTRILYAVDVIREKGWELRQYFSMTNEGTIWYFEFQGSEFYSAKIRSEILPSLARTLYNLVLAWAQWQEKQLNLDPNV